jgi:hypothetical protein
MAVYLEFVALGPPVSNQSPGTNLATWRAAVAGQAALCWLNPPLSVDLKVVIINFYAGDKPSVDVDNMSKPILDVLQDIIYLDDKQIIQAEIAHSRIAAPFSIVGVRPVLVAAIQAGDQFVYVKVEDPVIPFPLPK